MDSFQAISGVSQVAGQTAQAGPSQFEAKCALSVAQDFESLLLSMLFKSMDKTVTKSGLFGSDLAGGFYQDMFFEQAASVLAHANPGTGIASRIANDLMTREGLKSDAIPADIFAGSSAVNLLPRVAAAQSLSEEGI